MPLNQPSQNAQGIGALIGSGLGMLQNRQSQKRAASSQAEAAKYLTASFRAKDDDPQLAQELFMKAYQLDPAFASKTVSGVSQFNKSTGTAYQDSAGTREFESLISDFSPEDKAAARRVKAGLSPRAVGSSSQTIADTGRTQSVAESESVIAGSKESAKAIGKAEGRKVAAPIIAEAESLIASEVEKAKSSAKSQGEAVSQLKIAKASLPALNEVVDNLIALSDIATSTMSGTAADFLVKEAGFGATKGATAKAKFIAIVDNQVLPLLKQTFGAAFTVKEAESLKKTLGDPEAAPKAKKAQLEAFIEGKMREIETKERELGVAAGEDSDRVVMRSQQYGDVTEGDILLTIKETGMTREQVIKKLGGK